MRRWNLALLGLALLSVATAVTAATATGPSTPAVAPPASAPAVAGPTAALPDNLFAPQPDPMFTCPPPTTTCNSCLYFGTPSGYSCSTWCVNGVFHRSCGTCGEGCNN
jgi:hypothetical protein